MPYFDIFHAVMNCHIQAVILKVSVNKNNCKPSGNYMFKVNTRNTRTLCETCSNMCEMCETCSNDVNAIGVDVVLVSLL